MPRDTGESAVKETICRVLSLTGYEVNPNDLYTRYRLKKSDKVILKFKDEKLKRNIQIEP